MLARTVAKLVALDPSLTIHRFGNRDLVKAGASAAQSGIYVLEETRGTGAVVSLLRSDGAPSCGIAHPKGGRLREAREALGYDTLHDLGVVAVAGDARSGSLVLTGGSVCSCILQRRKDLRWRVIKSSGTSLLHEIDTAKRHRLEAQFVQGLHDLEVPLFPAMKLVAHSPAIIMDFDFIPAYTLGEWFLQADRPMSQCCSAVTQVFMALREHLYQRTATDLGLGNKSDPEPYHEKVQRRLTRLMDIAVVQSQVLDTLYQRGGVVNGLSCRPIAEQLSLSKSLETRLKNSSSGFICHGDLIPEDILVDRLGHAIAFLDPNPQNKDPIMDLGKMAMSCLLSYDLALRDWIAVSIRFANGQLFAQTNTPAKWNSHVRTQEQLGWWILESGVELLGHRIVGTPERRDPRLLLLLASLQAMALPVFHSVHHARPERAMYFLTKGMWMMEKALRALGE